MMFKVFREANKIIVTTNQAASQNVYVDNQQQPNNPTIKGFDPPFQLLPPFDKYTAELRYLKPDNKFVLKSNGWSIVSENINVVLFVTSADGNQSRKQFYIVNNSLECDDELKENSYRIEITNLPTYKKGSDQDHHERMEQMFVSGQFSDITLNVNGQLIAAHKNILSCYSDVFEAMFQGNFIENTTQIVNIENTEYDAMKAAVKYCYTCSVEIQDVNSALQIFMVAHKYNIESLQVILEKYIKKMVSPYSAVNVLCVESFINNSEIKRAALDELLEVSPEELVRICNHHDTEKNICVVISEEQARRLETCNEEH